MLHWFGKRLRELQEMKRDERGFTLVELMVVIIIIAILAAIAIPIMLATRDNAREAAAQSDLRNAAAAANTCAADFNGSFDTCGDGADGSGTGALGAGDRLIATYDLNLTPGVTVTVTQADANRWVATAVHAQDATPTTYTFDSDTGTITGAG
jgi:type IV pilus assembly protein PilA